MAWPNGSVQPTQVTLIDGRTDGTDFIPSTADTGLKKEKVFVGCINKVCIIFIIIGIADLSH